jgi:hypothetical protein
MISFNNLHGQHGCYCIQWLLFNSKCKWVSDYCLSPIFQPYHDENKLIFSEMMMRSALCNTSTLSLIFIVLAHWNNSPSIDMLPHSFIGDVMVSVLASSAVDRGFIGDVMVSVLASSAVDRGFIGDVMVSVITSPMRLYSECKIQFYFY